MSKSKNEQAIAEFKNEWILISPDGGTRWIIGRKVRDDGDRVSLSPAFTYRLVANDTPDGAGMIVNRVIDPILLFSNDLEVEVRKGVVVHCSQWTNDEIENHLVLLVGVKKKQDEIRAKNAGLTLPPTILKP